MSKKKTNEDFIEECRHIYGNRYDYSKTLYKDALTKIKVICREHGEFETLPNVHKSRNCRLCANKTRFRKFHNTTMKNKFEKVTQHKKYKNIPLNKDTFVKVDNDDFYRFCNISWYKSTGSSAYIYAYNSNLGFMHRIIMQAPKGMVVDHINGDTLDNRKSNLRICTPQQNKFNSKTRRDSSTGVKGVFKTKYGWFALVKMGSIFKRSKTYCTIQEAEKYYKKYAKELHQEYAKI